jgi:hypothetical protein
VSDGSPVGVEGAFPSLSLPADRVNPSYPLVSDLLPKRVEIDYAVSEQGSAGEMTTQSNETPAGQTPGNAPETPPTPEVPTPTPQPPAQPSAQPSHNPSFTEVMNSLNALPEKIVGSLREAMQPPAQPKSTPKTESTPKAPETPQTPVQGHTKPGKKSFGEWWFGR